VVNVARESKSRKAPTELTVYGLHINDIGKAVVGLCLILSTTTEEYKLAI